MHTSVALLLQLEVAEKDVRSWLWISRVPSHSNPSDGPSRGDNSFVKAVDAIRDGCSCPILGCALADIVRLRKCAAGMFLGEGTEQ